MSPRFTNCLLPIESNPSVLPSVSLADLSWLPQPLNVADLQDEDGRALVALVADSLQEKAKRQRLAQWVVQTTTLGQATLVTLNNGRHSRRWRWINEPLSDALWRQTLEVLLDGRDAMLWPQGAALPLARQWVLSEGSHQIKTRTGVSVEVALGAYRQPRQVVVELAAERDARSQRALIIWGVWKPRAFTSCARLWLKRIIR